jgi:hypothetical protein
MNSTWFAGKNTPMPNAAPVRRWQKDHSSHLMAPRLYQLKLAHNTARCPLGVISGHSALPLGHATVMLAQRAITFAGEKYKMFCR